MRIERRKLGVRVRVILNRTEAREAGLTALQKSGKLEAALQQAAQQTAREMDDLEQQGMTEHEAWEMTRESTWSHTPRRAYERCLFHTVCHGPNCSRGRSLHGIPVRYR